MIHDMVNDLFFHDKDETALMSFNTNCDDINMQYCWREKTKMQFET